MRLSPRDPVLWALLFNEGTAHFLLGQDQQAIDAFRRTLALRPEHFHTNGCLAAALALTGRLDEAREKLARCLAASPLKTVAAWKAHGDPLFPAYRAELERLYEGLRLAGMPES